MTAADSLDFPAFLEAELRGESWPAVRCERQRRSACVATLQRLEAYISSDESSLQRQRAILSECQEASPARAIAEATIAEYQRSLQTLYKRRAKLIAKSPSDDRK